MYIGRHLPTPLEVYSKYYVLLKTEQFELSYLTKRR